MKRQINYILMQTVLWGGWICEYIWFLKHQFQMRFDLWVFVAYLFLLYLCVVRKLGNNNNRRYEIYMELWGRLTAVNVVWYLFVGAKNSAFCRHSSGFMEADPAQYDPVYYICRYFADL